MELNDKVAEKIANIFIERIKTIRYTPHATWVKTKHHHPQNISGRLYQGVFNNFFLLLDCTVHKYDHPFYLTLHQARFGIEFQKRKVCSGDVFQLSCSTSK